MKRLIRLVFFALCLANLKGWAQLPVAEIPEMLSKNADAVVREYRHEIVVVNQSVARERVSSTITIFSSDQKALANLYIPYDRFSKVLAYTGTVYDKNGNVLKKLKKSDFEDISATSSGTLFGDNRIIAYANSLSSFPLTFQYEYEKEYNGLLFVSPFDPVPDYDISVQQATYSISCPRSVGLKYMVRSNLFSFVDQSDDNNLALSWKLEDMEPLKSEPFSPPASSFFPYVLVAAENFQMDAYQGSMASWKSFGQWINQLNQGKDDLGPAAVEQVELMTAGLSTTEKIKKLYEFLQSRTRYVSVQLGIGGWQPFPASMVEQNGYGDCKALVNYMKTLLKVAGIESNYTLVRAGARASDINVDFPSSQFNHVILAVPVELDTIWLECTSQTQPFGFLGSFTANRHALLINEKGGTIVRTPAYTAEQNLQHTKTQVILGDGGQARLQLAIASQGIQTENNGLEQMVMKHENEQKKWLNETLGDLSFELVQFKISRQNASSTPHISQEIELIAKNIYSTSGTRLFVKPNIVNQFDPSIPYTAPERKLPVFLRSAFYDIDSTTINIPDGYRIEFMPANQSIKTAFGTYETHFSDDDNKVFYYRKLKLNGGQFPADQYGDLIQFFKQIKKQDEVKVVLVKNT